MITRFVVAALLAAAPLSPLQAQLNSTERAISTYLSDQQEDGIDLLARAVRIGSGTQDTAGVHRMGSFLAQELRQLGFQVRWIPEGDVGRAGHLVAERTGSTGKSILLIGHLDTVLEGEGWFERDGMTGRGPGTNDMKGGDIAIIMALRALHHAGALKNRTIRVIFTGDEESPGEPLAEARGPLIALADSSDVALEFETAVAGDEHDFASTARRGSTTWLLEVGGHTAHSSGIFSDEVGAGAVFEAARILDAFYNELKGEQYLTFNPAIIVGGTDVQYDPETIHGSASAKTNIVAQRVVVHGGIRTISDEQLARARQHMREIVAGHLPGTTATITFFDGYPGMPPTDGNRQLLALYDQGSRDLGLGPVVEFDPGGRGASDLSFAAGHVRLGSLGGLGVEGEGSHTPDEYVDLSTIRKSAARAALLIYRLR